MPATAQVRIAADTKQFKRAMDDVNDRISTLGKLSRGIGASLRGALSFAGNTAGLTILGGVPAVLGASAKAFSKFEKNMMEVYTLLPNANRAFFEEMKRDALSFSEEFGIMPEEVSRGMYQAISSGVAPEGLDEGFLKIAQEAAIAGVTDLKTSVDALTNVVNSYGEGVYDMQYVSDLMFKSVAMSKTTFRELADYMYQILPTAGSLGLRLDDLFGSISALAATGTLTRVGTTQLRQFLIEISRTGDKANMAFLQASRGKPFEEYIKEGGRLLDVVKMLGDYAKSRQISMRNLFGSVEAGNAALTLAKSTNFTGMVEALEDPSGAQAQATAKMMDTLGFKFARIKRTSMNNFIKLGEVLKPVFKDILDFMEQGMNRMRNFDWQNLGQRFQQEWSFIKKLIREDKIFDYLAAQLKSAFSKAAVFIVETVQRIFDSLSNMISVDASSVTGLGSALGDIAVAFVDRILLGFAKLSPLLMSSLAPFMAFFSASIERIKANLLPDDKKDMAGVREAKTEAFKRRHGSLQDMLSQDPNALAKALSHVDDLYKEHGEKMFSSFRSFEGLERNPGLSLLSTAREMVAGIKGQEVNMVNPEEQMIRSSLRDVLDNINGLSDGSLRFVLRKHGFEDQRELLRPEGIMKGFSGLYRHLDTFIRGRQEKLNEHNRNGDRGFRVMMKADEISYATKLKRSLMDLENYYERIVQISDENLGKTRKIDAGEVAFNEVYKRDSARIEGFAEDIQEALDDNYERDVQAANEKIKKGFSELTDKVKGLRIELGELEMAPVRDSLAIRKLKEKIVAFDKEIEAYEKGKPPLSDFAEEEPRNDGSIFKKTDPLISDYEVRGFMPSVTGDSKTKIGAGGGVYGFDPEDQLIDSNLALKNSLDALNTTVSNFAEIPDQIALGETQAATASYSAPFVPTITGAENVKEFIAMLDELKLEDIKKSFQKKGDPEEQSNQMKGFIAQWNKLVPSAPIAQSVATEYNEINFKRSMEDFKAQGESIATSLLDTIRIMKTAKPVYDEKGQLVENEAALIGKINGELKGGFNNYNEFLDFITRLSRTSSGEGRIDENFRDKVDQKAPTQLERYQELAMMEGLLGAYSEGSRELEMPQLRAAPMIANANRKVAGIEDLSGVFRQIPSRIDIGGMPEYDNVHELLKRLGLKNIPESPTIMDTKATLMKKVEPINRVFGTQEMPKSRLGEEKTDDRPFVAPTRPSVTEEPIAESFQKKVIKPFFTLRPNKEDNATMIGGKKAGSWEMVSEESSKSEAMPADALAAFNQGAESSDGEAMPKDVLAAFNQGIAEPFYKLKPAPKEMTPLVKGQKAGKWEMVSSSVNNHLMNGASAQVKASNELLRSAEILKASIKEKSLDAQPAIEPINF